MTDEASPRRALVTGGGGFVGSHLAERLHAAGHAVTVLDDLSTGRFENLLALDGRPRFQFVRGSVLEPALVEELVRGADMVFHLASAVGVRLIMEQPVATIETIVQGTRNVLQAASRYHRRTLITSSSEVYGKSRDVPFAEDGDRLQGATSKHRWAYACAKSMDEFLALAHFKESRLPVTVARLFNTVGPRQTDRYGMVIPRFVRAALAGEALEVHGDGRQTRCFAHAADVVAALIALGDEPVTCGEVYNVGSTEEVSVLELARRVLALAGEEEPDRRLRFRPYRDVYGEGFEDMLRRVPDTRKIEAAVGWRPTRSLADILADVFTAERGRPPATT